ncbi:ribonucleotide-diphosphate reductase subunit beta [Acidipila rosea]|uniref:Ribonucleoside-diphosphate reductase subunit beta n=1 Tax=Acidipila rosea TaxID=768535 RepID=A0A4V2PVT9_9BACT|nr:ribonucleotide-diphosphate reductase subunit beta [Acidipila rosea]MBW4025823.1 ribonucleotide-diphosphate reductase subunit beta [Acidobacteriota bacterium]MBW4044258.1 ribonucleotide-diphosphate reductase subunit beta [Acidobacteriota bacterium]TCK75711.1 ribonucleoside-diphosphate reductase beta chain [Acidipila rosea]
MSVQTPVSILDPGLSLTLRPMKYPVFYEMFKDGIKNTWTVEEVDFSTDLADLRSRLTPAEVHLIQRLVAFFATGDSIVSNNLVLNLYKHINSPEARLYLSRQLFEEAVHVQFYLTLLDNYVPDPDARAAAFSAVENIPSIAKKAQFCMKWMDSIQQLDELRTPEHQRQFLLNLICFAGAIEGLFFFAAFAYVYFLRSRGLLHGLAAGTNWVFRDESAHLEFAFEVVNTVRNQHPNLFDAEMERQVVEMLTEAVDCETQFAQDLLSGGVAGLSIREMRQYLEYVADSRLARLGMKPVFNSKNPFGFMELQDVQELTNFFERRVSAYQVAVAGEVAFHEDF